MEVLALDALPADPAGARAEWEQALERAGRDGDDRLRAPALSNLAALALREGRVDEAEAGFRAALPLFRAFGDPRGEVIALDGLARVALLRGDTAAALATREQALAVARASGRADLLAHTLGLRSDSLEREGRLGEALGEALAARQAASDAGQVEVTTRRVARLHLRRGEHDDAGRAIATLAGGAGELRGELALRRGEVVREDEGSPLVHALFDALSGDLRGARRRLRAPMTPFDAVLLGLLDHAEGQVEAAADRLAVARDALARTGWRADAAIAGVYAAAALADAGRAKLAEALLAEAEEELFRADAQAIGAEFDVTRAHLALARGDRDSAEVLLGAARARPASAAPTLRLRLEILQHRLFPT